jgi:glycosyltransferase involved in cell wall biosynthesis
MKRDKIAIVHYSYPPVIGGVEFIMQGHAQVLAGAGYTVKILAGEGNSAHKNVQVVRIKELLPAHERVKNVTARIEKRGPGDDFDRLKKKIYASVAKALEDVRTCFIHNVMTMHFNLPFTAAFSEVMNDMHDKVRFCIWCHDATVLNPSYSLPRAGSYPWSLLTSYHRHARYVAISAHRRRQLSKLFGVTQKKITVVPDGLDVRSFLDISEPIWRAACALNLFERDLVMLFPSRILRRKNYELGIRIVAEMKKLGKKVTFLITGPPDPHNPATVTYFKELLALRKRLGVEKEVVFLANPKGLDLKIGFEELKSLYAACDMLLITSWQEGFGIPLMEAASRKMPIACSDIAPLPEVVEKYACLFGLTEKPATIARRIIRYLKRLPTHYLFKKVLFTYSWEAIYTNHLSKLVEEK